MKWAFFRQEPEKDLLKLVYCPTEVMRADLLTKPLRGKVFRDHDSAIRDGEHMNLRHLEGRVKFMYCTLIFPCVEHEYGLVLLSHYCSSVTSKSPRILMFGAPGYPIA